MKREALNHPKMLDLACRLGIPKEYARGIILTLLDWAADMAPQGNVGKWADGVIAMACGWQGDATKFVEALADAGWLDRCPVHRYIIHDLEDHAERWWKLKLQKLGLTFLKPAVERSREQPTEHLDSIERSKERSILQTPSNQTPSNPSPSPSEAGLERPPVAHASQDEPLGEPLDPTGRTDWRQPNRPGPQSQPSMVPIPEPLDTPEFRSAWSLWLEVYREANGRWPPQRSLEMTLVKLARASPEEATARVLYSAEKGYKGVVDRLPAESRPAAKPFMCLTEEDLREFR